MNTIYMITFFVLGTLLGSFYNVVGFRLPNNKSIVYPNSSCPLCHHRLGFKDLIPIFSYLFLKGKCRYCHKKISMFYPIIEMLSGILFAVSYYSFGFTSELLTSLTLVSLLMIVLVSDLNYYIIPDEVILFTIIILIGIDIFGKGITLTGVSVMYGIFSFIIMYLLMLLGNWLFKKESLGGADVKIMFIIGYVLGPILTLTSIFLSSIIALPISIYIYYRHRENIIPFGPFLLISMLVIFLMKIDINKIIELIKL